MSRPYYRKSNPGSSILSDRRSYTKIHHPDNPPTPRPGVITSQSKGQDYERRDISLEAQFQSKTQEPPTTPFQFLTPYIPTLSCFFSLPSFDLLLLLLERTRWALKHLSAS